jgi:gas vesicle protein
MKRNGSHLWPYVVVGSAVGGAAVYLWRTESCRKIRHSLTHPDELADNLEDARSVIEKKAKVFTGRVHEFIQTAKRSIEDGERAYHEAEQGFRSRARQFEAKNNQIASKVHNTVDNLNRTAVTIEESVLDPFCEIGALVQGVQRGIRSLFGKTDRRTVIGY